MSTLIRSAIVALTLIGTVSAASVAVNAAPYGDVHEFWQQFTRGR